MFALEGERQPPVVETQVMGSIHRPDRFLRCGPIHIATRADTRHAKGVGRRQVGISELCDVQIRVVDSQTIQPGLQVGAGRGGHQA